MTIPVNKTAFIDPRRYTFAEVVATTCHEALHLKQIQEGRLVWDEDLECLVWDGAPHDTEHAPDPRQEDLDTYRSLPWEIDVQIQERELFLEVCKQAKIPFTRYPQTFVKLKGEKSVYENPKIIYETL